MDTATVLILLLAIMGQVVGVTGQETPEKVKSAKEGTPRDAAALRSEELRRSAARYRIVTTSDPPKDLVLKPAPVLLWTNPLRSTFAGAVFVWVSDGRPEAVASVFRYTEEGKTVEDNEFQSLASTGLTAGRDSQTVWAPRTAGLQLSPIPNAPQPAPTAAERLRQMHVLRVSSMPSSTHPGISRNCGSCPSPSTGMRRTAATCSTGPCSRSC